LHDPLSYINVHIELFPFFFLVSTADLSFEEVSVTPIGFSSEIAEMLESFFETGCFPWLTVVTGALAL